MAEVDFCAAMSQRGAPITAFVHGQVVFAVAKHDGGYICTQDPRHEKSHAACDGQGHILARWPRSSVERYWRPGDCDGHDHESGAA